jgi:hypothetical protein
MRKEVPTKSEQERIVEKAKHYVNLVGSDFSQSKENIAAMAMAMGWVMGQREKNAEDCIESGYKIAKTGDLLSTMITSATVLAVRCDTLEEAFLEDGDEEDDEEAA